MATRHHGSLQQGAAGAARALATALDALPGQRKEKLVNIVRSFPGYAPAWLALAEEHIGARRTEEARTAIHQALKLDPNIRKQMSYELLDLCPPVRKPSPSMEPLLFQPPRAQEEAPRPPEPQARPAPSQPGRSALPPPRLPPPRPVGDSRAKRSALPPPRLPPPRRSGMGSAGPERALAEALSATPFRRRERLVLFVELYPSHGPGWLALAEEYFAAGRTEDALDAYQRALDLDAVLEYEASPELVEAMRIYLGEPDPYDDMGDPALEVPRAEHRSARPDATGTPQTSPRPAFHEVETAAHAVLGAVSGADRAAIPPPRPAKGVMQRLGADEPTAMVSTADIKPPGGNHDAETVLVSTADIKPPPGKPEERQVITALLCKSCWSLITHDIAACPACRRPRPSAGWEYLPYRLGDRFLLVELLGRGDVSAVFRGHEQSDSSRAVAVKVLRGDLGDRGAGARAEIEREAQAAEALGHNPYFVQVIAAEATGAQPFLAMELMQWPTLRKILGQGRMLGPFHVARLGIALLHGVQAMHERNMVHRRLCPESIFVYIDNAEVTVKIANLGNWVHDSRVHTRDTSEAEALVNPEYPSPEQTRFGPMTTASDIYSIGTVLWEALTGARPFVGSGRSAQERLLSWYESSRLPPARPAAVPEPLYHILLKALSHDLLARGTAADMRRALEECASWLHASSARSRMPAATPAPMGALLHSNRFLYICLGVAVVLFFTAILISIR